jgi:hypothetical protein
MTWPNGVKLPQAASPAKLGRVNSPVIRNGKPKFFGKKAAHGCAASELTRNGYYYLLMLCSTGRKADKTHAEIRILV